MRIGPSSQAVNCLSAVVVWYLNHVSMSKYNTTFLGFAEPMVGLGVVFENDCHSSHEH